MKKAFYIAMFTFLGFLLQLFVHAVVERWYISLLVGDFATYGFGLSWEQWFSIHYAATVILAAAGIAFGFWQGIYWWKRIYVLDRFGVHK